jgi:hypothetical protein
MAKRKSDVSGLIIIFMIIMSAISSATEWAKTHQYLVIGIVGLIISYFILKIIWSRRNYKRWVTYLKEKYGNDMDVVNAILGEKFWQGQSSEQLLDSLGKPDAIDRQVLKTKIKEVWKYQETRKNRCWVKTVIKHEYPSQTRPC